MPSPTSCPRRRGVEFAELGCGGGQASVGTAAEGADRVVGVDFSTAQLDHARRLRDCYGVDTRFVAGDVTTLPLADDAFDVAFSGWVVQMIEDLDAYLSEARRVLRDEGVLGVDVPHPFYECFDPAAESIERSYHGPRRREITIDEGYDANLIVFDRTVSDLHNAVVDAGFDVRRVLEPGATTPRCTTTTRSTATDRR